MSIQSAAFRFVPGAIVLLATTACSINYELELQETRDLELSVEPGEHLFIEAGAGSLNLSGKADLDQVRVTAEIYQREPNDDYELSLSREQRGQMRLIAENGRNAGQTAIALSIEVPEWLPVTLDDGSGSIEIENLVADIDVEDGSGSIRIENIQGNVTIEDGSGSITAVDISGNLGINDGSGSITARDIGGTVVVDDGSGSITVTRAGDFQLIEDGSGSVNLEDIASRSGR